MSRDIPEVKLPKLPPIDVLVQLRNEFYEGATQFVEIERCVNIKYKVKVHRLNGEINTTWVDNNVAKKDKIILEAAIIEDACVDLPEVQKILKKMAAAENKFVKKVRDICKKYDCEEDYLWDVLNMAQSDWTVVLVNIR